MTRRRYLLSVIASAFKWIANKFTYLYNSIIPTTFNKTTELPNEYQEVEYIESSGTQYIDFGIQPTTNMKFEMDFQGTNNNVGQMFFGGRNSGDGNPNSSFVFGRSNAGQFYAQYDSVNNVVRTLEFDLLRHITILSKDGWYIDGVLYRDYPEATSLNSIYNFLCFAGYNGTETILYGYMKFYGGKLYNNNVLIRNFIPCYRKSDSVIGLYDTVNKVFYTNAGTGTFLKGNDINRKVLSKARLSTIEGNSVVDNQLVNTNTSTITLTNGHKYLTYVNGTWSYVNGTNQTLSVSGGTDMVIDLTKMFPFDTPTTLTDNRVKALINRGTIPYNVGEIKNSVISEITCTRLPKEYQEVEYIESHGTEYIDTGVILTQSNKVVFNASFTQNTISAKGVFGSRVSANENNFAISYYEYSTNVSLALDFNNSGYTTYRLTRYLEFETIYQFIIDKNERAIYRNSALIDSNTTLCNDNINSGLNAYIFTTNGTSWSSMYGKLYSCKIYDNNVLVRDFVPCYRVSDNEIGLYDLVNGVFYTNQGTGTFSVGKNVNNNTIIKLPAPLEIAGVNTAHNTFQITNNGYVFTRKTWNARFYGNESWAFESANNFFYINKAETDFIQPASGKAICSNGLVVHTYITSQILRVYLSENPQLTSSSNLHNYFTATTRMQYALATPQVINIPKKHLGWVDLSTIIFTEYATNKFSANVSELGIKTSSSSSVPSNMYHNDLIAVGSSTTLVPSSKQMTIQGGILYIANSSWNSASDVKGILFFETNAETTDFNKEMNIQSGGYLNSDSQVLPNVEMLLKCK